MTDEIAGLGDIPGVKYMKDTSGDAVSLMNLLVSKQDRISAFNGWDTLTFFGMATGAKASVWGQAGIVPELAVQLWDAVAVRRDLDEGLRLWRPLWALADFLESVNYVAAIKAAMAMMGRPVGGVRGPMRSLNADQQSTLRRQLDIVANNIANANTTGFKTEDLMVATEQAKPAKTLDGSSPVKFVLDAGVTRDFTQGAMTKTGGDLDLGGISQVGAGSVSIASEIGPSGPPVSAMTSSVSPSSQSNLICGGWLTGVSRNAREFSRIRLR